MKNKVCAIFVHQPARTLRSTWSKNTAPTFLSIWGIFPSDVAAAVVCICPFKMKYGVAYTFDKNQCSSS